MSLHYRHKTRRVSLRLTKQDHSNKFDSAVYLQIEPPSFSRLVQILTHCVAEPLKPH